MHVSPHFAGAVWPTVTYSPRAVQENADFVHLRITRRGIVTSLRRAMGVARQHTCGGGARPVRGHMRLRLGGEQERGMGEEEEGKEARLMTRVQVQRGRPQGRRRSKKRWMEERRKRKARE